MDSITKADGMEGVRLVHWPGSVLVVLTTDALGLIADALEFTADDSRTIADNRMDEGDGIGADIARSEAARMDLLAEVVRASGQMCADMDRNDDHTRALVEALVDAGAQA